MKINQIQKHIYTFLENNVFKLLPGTVTRYSTSHRCQISSRLWSNNLY